MTDDIQKILEQKLNHFNEITEEDDRLHFMRQEYHKNLAEREAWNDALISYEEYYQGNMEYLEEKWATFKPLIGRSSDEDIEKEIMDSWTCL